MIAFVMSKAGRWLIGSLAAFALLAAAYAYIDHKGYQRAATHYMAQIAAEHAALAEADANEQRRQTIANNAAKKREAEAIAEMDRLESENTEIRRKLRDEAAKDPDASKPSLSARSVQRLNQIR